MITKSNNSQYEVQRVIQNYRVEINPSLGIGSHFHPQLEVLVVKNGKIKVTINGDTRILEKGDIAITDAFDIHSYEILEDKTDSYYFILSDDLMMEYQKTTDGMQLNNPFLCRSDVYKKILPLFDQLRELNGKMDNSLYKNGLIFVVVGLITDAIGYTSKKKKAALNTMIEVMVHIHENILGDLSLKTLSKKFGYTPNHFSSMFNSYTKTGLKDYINSIRASNAFEMIKNGTNVLNASMQAGFESDRTFYRAFSERYGMSPKAYLKKNRSKDS